MTPLRTLIALAACTLVLAVVGCGESGSPSAEPPPPESQPAGTTETAPPAEPAPAESGTGETDTTGEEPAQPPAESPPPPPPPGTLVVALNLPNQGFQVGAVDGDQVVFAKGFEVELVRALAGRLGSPVQFIQVDHFPDLVSAGDKPWDLAIAQVTITDKRERRVDFSEPYLLADQGVLLRKGFEPVPTSIADLRPLQLCTQDGTTASDLIRREIRPDVRPKRFARQAQLFEELQAGACDAAILDAPILGAERAQLPFRYGPLAGLIATGESYGIVLPQRSSLREQVDGALADLIADGTIERLSTRWLSTDLASLPLLE